MLLTLYHESLQKSSQKRRKAQNQQKKSTYPEKKVRAQRKKKRNERKCRYWREAERRGKQMSEHVLMLSPAPTSQTGCHSQCAEMCRNVQYRLISSFFSSTARAHPHQHCPHNSGENVTKCHDALPDANVNRQRNTLPESAKKSTRLYENRQNRRDARQRESVRKREVLLDAGSNDRGHPHAQPMLHVSAALAGVNPAVPPVSSERQ